MVSSDGKANALEDGKDNGSGQREDLDGVKEDVLDAVLDTS